jgi:alpha-L-arabinofuranosidase
VTARITVSHARLARSATLERVVADSVAAVNGFSTPDAVRTTRESIRVRNSFSLELPRHSVTVLTLTVEK